MTALVYYDLVLIAIGMSLIVGASVGFMTGVAMTVAVPAFSVVAIALVGHALFINGPVDEPEELTKEVDPGETPGVAIATQIVG